MNDLNTVLKKEEEIVFSLRKLYSGYGFSQYKIGKFEEYDMYAKNKDFLVSNNMITFTDTNGKLMALKPDATLSIIKNSKMVPGELVKVFYDENVFRVSKATEGFKEITQAGLECLGAIDEYQIFEVLLLACKSLETISDEYVLDVSHLKIVAEAVKAADFDSEDEKEVLKCISAKNEGGISAVCDKCGVDERVKKVLCALASIYGSYSQIKDRLNIFDISEGMKQAVSELKSIVAMLSAVVDESKVRIDFSVINDTNYYSGIVFKGVINGIPSGVLTGGQYDYLMKKMGKNAGAIGFAVYIDLLERFFVSEHRGADVTVTYGEDTDMKELFVYVDGMRKQGKRVNVISNKAKSTVCGEIVEF